jgi:hypothetical protein
MNGLSSLTNKGPRYITTCKLCTASIAETNALNVPLEGHPGASVEKLIKVLVKHLQTHHLQELQQGVMLSNEFAPFLILSAFRFEDPSLPRRLEMMRGAIFAHVRKNTMSDDAIAHIVATWGLDPEDAVKVNEGMRALRDVLCEFGEFAPKPPDEKLIIT